jgi:hypothetical protein
VVRAILEVQLLLLLDGAVVGRGGRGGGRLLVPQQLLEGKGGCEGPGEEGRDLLAGPGPASSLRRLQRPLAPLLGAAHVPLDHQLGHPGPVPGAALCKEGC